MPLVALLTPVIIAGVSLMIALDSIPSWLDAALR